MNRPHLPPLFEQQPSRWLDRLNHQPHPMQPRLDERHAEVQSRRFAERPEPATDWSEPVTQTQAQADARSKERAEKPRYWSPSRSESVSISLYEFSDEEIAAEHAHRQGASDATAIEISKGLEGSMDHEYDVLWPLQRIRTLLLCGQDAQALAAMRELCRDLLGTAL